MLALDHFNERAALSQFLKVTCGSGILTLYLWMCFGAPTLKNSTPNVGKEVRQLQ